MSHIIPLVNEPIKGYIVVNHQDESFNPLTPQGLRALNRLTNPTGGAASHHQNPCQDLLNSH